MPEISNPYQTEGARKTSVGELERRLASFVIMFLALHVSLDEEDAIAKTIGVGLRSFPWAQEMINEPFFKNLLSTIPSKWSP